MSFLAPRECVYKVIKYSVHRRQHKTFFCNKACGFHSPLLYTAYHKAARKDLFLHYSFSPTGGSVYLLFILEPTDM